MEGKPNHDILESTDNGGLAQQAMMYATGELEAECDDEVFQQCRLVGERGGAKVLYFTGLYYHYGWGTARDLRAAVECYVRAAGLGSLQALEQLHDLRGDHSMKTNIQNAFQSFCMRADQGDARALFNAGFCYFYGTGTPEDRLKARDLLLKGANQRCADAMWMLEWCRHYGVGDGYNGRQGIELWRHAAELGSVEAQYELGHAYYFGVTVYGLKVEKDYQQAVEWFQKAADQNHAAATNNLACCYCNGEGVQKDIKKALALWRKAALMGNGDARDYISDFYRHGYFDLDEDEWPVGIDYFEAAYWNRKAVDQNHEYAKNSMPDILKSIGLTQNQIKELMKQACSFESAKIWYIIAKQYEAGDGVEKDEKKAFGMYRLSARIGNIPAKIALGRCYENGIGTEVDTQQTIYWYEKATKQGHNEAAKSLLSLIQSESMSKALKTESPFAALAECYQTGNGVLKNEDTALLMREHAAVNGDIQQTRMIIEAYISGNGSEYKIKTIGSIVAKTSGLSRKDYQQFIDKFLNCIDELDKFQIFQNAAAAARAETLEIHIIIE